MTTILQFLAFCAVTGLMLATLQLVLVGMADAMDRFSRR